MGLINNIQFKAILDRVASQANLWSYYITSGQQVGTRYYKTIHSGLPVDGDFDVENDLISAADGVDNNTISGTMFKNIYSTLIQQLEAHGTNQGAASFNSWLNISGINVHEAFNAVYHAVKGIHLDGRNVFFNEDNILISSFTSTSSGAGTYASSNPLSTTGTGAFSESNHAAAGMLLVPIQNTGADIQLNLRLLAENPSTGTQTDSCNILIPSGTLSGTQFSVNNMISGGHNYINVTNMLAAGGDGNDVFYVYALRERDITA